MPDMHNQHVTYNIVLPFDFLLRFTLANMQARRMDTSCTLCAFHGWMLTIWSLHNAAQ